MADIVLRRISSVVVCTVTAAVLGSVAALGQSTVASPAAGPETSEHTVLPEEPSASSSSVQGQTSERPQQVVRQDDKAPGSSVTVVEETLIRVMTNAPMSSRQARPGMPVLCTVSEDVKAGDVLAIPRGATVHATVVQSKRSGVLTGSPELTLELVSLDLDGRSYPLYTYQFHVKGTSKTEPTETKVREGTVVGALVGGVFSGSAKGGATDTGRAVGMATGAGVGAGVGAAVSAATPGPGISIPAEAQVDFYLAAPIAVPPVSEKEAARLALRLHGGAPSLYVRDDLH